MVAPCSALQTDFGAQQAFKRDESEEWGASVWDSSNDEL
jgi:hypothetical protein